MKKRLFYGIFALLSATLLCSCTPKSTSIWCTGLNNINSFSFDYSVINNTYDGSVRSFTVKDENKFEAYLETLEEFSSKIEMSDSTEKAFIFKRNGETYEIVKKDNNEYYLSSCKFVIYDNENNKSYYFAYVPITSMYTFDTSGVIRTIQKWEYFSNFYKDYKDATIDDVSCTITLPLYSNSDTKQITLTYNSYEISYGI